MPVPQIPQQWRSAGWWRARLRLTFTGRERKGGERSGDGLFHPAFVLQCLWYDAMREHGGWQRPAFTWHVDGPSLERFVEGAAFDALLVFPADSGEEAWRRLADHWSSQRAANFAITPLALEPRDLRVLESENPFPCAVSDEPAALELNFHSPWTFKAPNPGRSWQPDAQVLGRALAGAAGLFLEPAGPQEEWPETLCLNACHWRLVRLQHDSASRGGGARRHASGFQGPLFLEAAIPELNGWWPWLLLGAEFHLGKNRNIGFGRYVPGLPAPFLDPQFANEGFLSAVWNRMEQDMDPMLSTLPLCAPGEQSAAIAALAEALRTKTWAPVPATVHLIGKHVARIHPESEPGDQAVNPIIVDPNVAGPEPPAPPPAPSAEQRAIVSLADADRLVHKALAEVLARPLERLFSPALHSYRRGRSVSTAIHASEELLRQGFHHVVKLDVASYFDEIPWPGLLRLLRKALPAPDESLFQALEEALCTPVLWGERPMVRTRGLLQGSPLSPLLSNLYLTPFDRALELSGWHHLRYGDDIAIFCSSPEGAKQALERASSLLGEAGLRVRPEKTLVLDASQTPFRYLGAEVGGPDGPPSPPDDPPLRRPVYLSPHHQWAGCEAGALVLREGRQLVERLPLSHVSELILSGLGGLSVRLVEECLGRRIPLTLCDGVERHLATLVPDPRVALDAVIAHHQRFTQTPAQDHLNAARDLVAGKIAAYQAWFGRSLPYTEVKSILRKLRAIRGDLVCHDTVDSLRGLEGEAARLVFPFVNRRLAAHGFLSQRRGPREKADPWNALLDTGYFLLFERIHTLLRAAGLHPYLGFLHSPHNHYPSLACDLQELFRARVDQLLSRLVMVRQIRPEHFARRPDGRWKLLTAGARILIREFETELDRHHYGERQTWRGQITLQVEMLRQWARGRMRLWLYQAPEARRQSSPAGGSAVAEEDG